MTRRTAICGGLVITASDEIHADVLIEDTRIAALAVPGTHSWSADRTIDATGKYVIPGGVDAHTHMELPFGGTFASDTFETGTRAAAWGRRDDHRGLRGAERRPHPARGSGRLARQGRGQLRDRLRLPHDRLRCEPGDAQGDGPAGRGGRDQLQAVHGVPGGLLLRRRADPARHAALRRQRRADHDARRERHRHRRTGRTGPWPGARRTPATTGRCARPCWRPRPRTAPSGSRRSPEPPVRRARLGDGGRRGAGQGPRRRAPRVRRDLPAVPVPVHRQPRRARLRGRQVRVQHPAAAPRAPGAPLEGACGPTTSRSSPPTTAPSASPGRRNWAGATSPGSPTGCPAWRTAWTCSTRRSWTGTSHAAAGSRSPAPPRPGCSACTRRRAPSPRAPTRTWSSTTRTSSRCCPPRPTT